MMLHQAGRTNLSGALTHLDMTSFGPHSTKPNPTVAGLADVPDYGTRRIGIDHFPPMSDVPGGGGISDEGSTLRGSR